MATGDPAAPTYRVLGPLEVIEPSGATLTLGPRQRQLLALLVLHRNTPVTGERLVLDLWGPDAPASAEVTLRSHLSHLRRRMEGTAVEGALTRGPAGYALAIAGARVDVDEFEHVQQSAQESLGLGQPARAAELARDALALWAGPPWADLDEVPDARADRVRLEELRLGTWEVRAAADLELGRHRELVPDLEVLVGEHPFREPFVALLMTALYRAGRQADALAAYSRTRERLVEELGLDPAPALRQLNEAVLRQDPTLLGPATAAPSAATPSRRASPDAVLEAVRKQPLVGRERELEALRAGWADVVSGGRRVVAVSGEAGLGKTRLVAEIARAAADDAGLVLVGRCADSGAAYLPLAKALGAVDDAAGLVASLPSGGREAAGLLLGLGADAVPAEDTPGQAPMYDAVVDLVGLLASTSPVLLVVEDAERIDAASAGALAHLAERMPARMMMVVCHRNHRGEPTPLSDLLGAPALSPWLEHLDLRPLDADAVARLVSLVAPGAPEHLAASVLRHTGGNPYFVAEIVREVDRVGRLPEDGALPLPVGLREALRRRLAALGPSTRSVLAAAGILGARIDFDVLATMQRTTDEELGAALEQAVTAGFLVEAGSAWVAGYEFPHDLMREAACLDLGPQELRRLHLEAARVLGARVGPHDRGAMSVAGHHRAAGTADDAEEVVSWCLRASQEARSLHAWSEALEHADAALAVAAERLPACRTADVAVRAADLRLRASRDFPRAVALLEQALELYTAAGDTHAAGLTHSRLGGALSVHHSTADVPRSLEHFAAAERLSPGVAERFHHQRGQAQAAMCAVATTLLETSAQRARTLARGLGRRDLDVVAGWALGWAAFNRGAVRESHELTEEAWQIAHDLSDPFLVWQAVQAPAVRANLYLLDPAGARLWCRRGLGHPRFATLPYSQVTMADQLAVAQALQGDLVSAAEVARDLPEDAVAGRVIAMLGGDPVGAAEAFDRAALADESRGDLHNRAHNHVWGAWARSRMGDRTGAVERYAAALEVASAGPQVGTRLAADAGLAAALAETDPDRAAAHLRACDEVLASGEPWAGLRGRVALARTLLARTSGDVEAVEAAGAEGVSVFGSLGLRWHQAESLSTWAACLTELGSARAVPLQREAETAHRLLATPTRRAPSGALYAASTRLPQPVGTVDP